jgi:ATP-dependent RNA helicase DHX8/PRP22
MKASVCFDGSLHLEAAKALEQIEGKVLPGCHYWQKIKCERLFHSYVSCPLPVYNIIRDQLESLLQQLEHRDGVECNLDRNENGSYRVKIAANATKTVAELRRPLERLMKGQTIDHPGLTPTIFQLIFSKEGFNLMKSVQKETKTYVLFDKHNFNIRIFGSPQNADLAQRKLLNSLIALHQSKQLEVHLRGGDLPPDLMKRVVDEFGPDLQGLKNKFPNAEFTLNTKYHVVSVNGSKDLKEKVKEVIYAIASTPDGRKIKNESSCPICLCEIDDNYRLENCGHEFCRSCLLDQFDSALKSRDSFPILCTYKNCKSPILLTDLRSLLSGEKLEELFRSSLGAYVASSLGKLRFCPTPDCPSVYKVEDESQIPFVCGACFVETCKRCHLECHAEMTCEKYKEFKEDPDSSLKEWCRGKENVKSCPVCGFTIEKYEGCNHVECRCGRHICWVCLEVFDASNDCYAHLRSIHLAII